MSSATWYKKPIVWILAVGVLLFLSWIFLLPDQPTSTEAVDPATYQAELQASRAKKDTFMRTSAESPIVDKATFRELLYFAPDASYRVTARLDPFPAGQSPKLVVHLTDGSEEVYEQYAHATFSLAGTACRLLVLKVENNLTVLFQDATSGKETYGGGRYIDIEPSQVVDKQVVLDFNAAYNPYCAYNPNYACPLPPPENRLPVAVKAGERYKAHD